MIDLRNANPAYFAGSRIPDCLEQRRNERKEILQLITLGGQDQVLLKLEVLISGHENVECVGGGNP